MKMSESQGPVQNYVRNSIRVVLYIGETDNAMEHGKNRMETNRLRQNKICEKISEWKRNFLGEHGELRKTEKLKNCTEKTNTVVESSGVVGTTLGRSYAEVWEADLVGEHNMETGHKTNGQGLNNIVKSGKQLTNRRETHLVAATIRLNDP